MLFFFKKRKANMPFSMHFSNKFSSNFLKIIFFRKKFAFQEKIENLLLTRKKKSCKIIADVRNDAIRIWKAMALTGQKDSLSCKRFFIFHSIRIIQ